jgi:hypothetical protein
MSSAGIAPPRVQAGRHAGTVVWLFLIVVLAAAVFLAALEVGRASRPATARPEAAVTTFPIGAGGSVIPGALGAVPQVDVRLEEKSQPKAQPVSHTENTPTLTPLKSTLSTSPEAPAQASAPAAAPVVQTQPVAPPATSTATHSHSSGGSGEFDTSG